jgi:hypothetical protein
MYAQVELPTAGSSVLAVPNSAVIDSGARHVVLIDQGEGRFEPREVKLGARGDEYVAIVDGVKEGERVVVAANFLIDAESNSRPPSAASPPPLPAWPPRPRTPGECRRRHRVGARGKSPVVGHRRRTVKSSMPKRNSVHRARTRRDAQVARYDDGLQGRQ